MQSSRAIYVGGLIIFLSIVVLFLAVAEVVNLNFYEKSPAEQGSSGTEKLQERAPGPELSDLSPKLWAERSTKSQRSVRNAVSSNLWSYEGSTLRLDIIGRTRRFYYAGLPEASPVKGGDMVFEGVREGPTYSGRAFLSSENCAPLAYQVKGSVSPDEKTIRMHGKKPQRDRQCKVLSYVDEELVLRLAERL